MKLLRVLAESFGSFLRGLAEELERTGALQRNYIALEDALTRKFGSKAKWYEHQREYAFQAAFYCAKQGMTLERLRTLNNDEPEANFPLNRK